MKELEEFNNYAIYILKSIYKNKINIVKKEYYEISLNNKINIIKTKYELKKYIRNIISSDNKNIESELIDIINLKYTIDRKYLKTLNEIFPNIEIFIAVYTKFKKEDLKIEIETYNYEKLFEYLINTYIETLRKRENEVLYEKMTIEEKTLKEEIKTLKEKLRIYRIVKENRIYYEIYENSKSFRKGIFKQDKKTIENKIIDLKSEIANINKKTLKKSNNDKKQLKVINKKIEIKNKELNFFIKELKEIIDQNKITNKKNDESFIKYINSYNLNIKDFKKHFNEIKKINAKELLDNINKKEEQLKEIIFEICNSNYLTQHLILKHFCLDNLKIIDKKSDMNNNILKNIIKILEENSK